MKQLITMMLFAVIVSSCSKEEEPTFNIDKLEVYGHAQEIVIVNYPESDDYRDVTYPWESEKIDQVEERSNQFFIVRSWVKYKGKDRLGNYQEFFTTQVWRSEVTYKNGEFLGSTIRFD